MRVRVIHRFLEEQYKVGRSADLISTVTDSGPRKRPEQVIPFFAIPRRSAKSSTRPTPSRACTCSHVTCSKIEGTSQ
jgi:hypothetical protein